MACPFQSFCGQDSSLFIMESRDEDFVSVLLSAELDLLDEELSLIKEEMVC